MWIVRKTIGHTDDDDTNDDFNLWSTVPPAAGYPTFMFKDWAKVRVQQIRLGPNQVPTGMQDW